MRAPSLALSLRAATRRVRTWGACLLALAKALKSCSVRRGWAVHVSCAGWQKVGRGHFQKVRSWLLGRCCGCGCYAIVSCNKGRRCCIMQREECRAMRPENPEMLIMICTGMYRTAMKMWCSEWQWQCRGTATCVSWWAPLQGLFTLGLATTPSDANRQAATHSPRTPTDT